MAVTVAAVATATARGSSAIQRGLPMITNGAVNQYAGVAKWILGCSGVVATIVHVGGVTRLTKSGLSMTDWKPLGSLPPISEEEWKVEFARYQSFPEWEQRESMCIDEFRRIYYWEWGHRMLGRTAGVCFALPWAYFAMKKRIPPGFNLKLAGLFGLGGAQGLVGWWMVRSGLGEDRRGDRHEIRVSPYRLATHLSVAFITFTGLTYTGLDMLQLTNSQKCRDLAQTLSKKALSNARKLRGGAAAVAALTLGTAVTGAFVAGNDAGNAFNTFPKMDSQWIPYNHMIDGSIFPVYRNAFETTAFVQWNHRVMAMITAGSALGLVGVGFFHPGFRAVATPQVRKGLAWMGAITTLQVSLGITTLLTYVPLELAAAHQVGSLALLTSGTYLVHSLRYASPSMLRLASKKVPTVGVVAKSPSWPKVI